MSIKTKCWFLRVRFITKRSIILKRTWWYGWYGRNDRRQCNIDSINNAAERTAKRRWLDAAGKFNQSYNWNRNNNYNHHHNHNHNHNHDQIGPMSLSFASTPVIQSLEYPPPMQQSMTQSSKMEQPPIDTALNQLHQ